MKKSKLIKSFLSIVLTVVFMFSLFSFSVVHKTATADMSLNGKLQSISNSISGFFSEYQRTDDSINDKSDEAKSELVYIGGYPVGLKLYADGVIIVGTEAVDTPEGSVDTAKQAGLKIGDIIKEVNNEPVVRTTQISDYMEQSEGNTVVFCVQRGNEVFEVSFKGAYSVSEKKYKAGIWVRDSSAGIGTVTFCRQDGGFASLGHAVCDIDTKMTLPILKGECTGVMLTGYTKGSNGAAGELCGYLQSDCIGTVDENGALGVYGVFNEVPVESRLYEIAAADEVAEGSAVIYTTVDNGEIKEYDVRIEKVDRFDKENKNLVLKVTDSDLIEKTGGIIQGMSGSPIVQNGKIIGAVTHVFLNDPTGGYGLLAENMFNCLKNIAS